MITDNQVPPNIPDSRVSDFSTPQKRRIRLQHDPRKFIGITVGIILFCTLGLGLIAGMAALQKNTESRSGAAYGLPEKQIYFDPDTVSAPAGSEISIPVKIVVGRNIGAVSFAVAFSHQLSIDAAVDFAANNQYDVKSAPIDLPGTPNTQEKIFLLTVKDANSVGELGGTIGSLLIQPKAAFSGTSEVKFLYPCNANCTLNGVPFATALYPGLNQLIIFSNPGAGQMYELQPANTVRVTVSPGDPLPTNTPVPGNVTPTPTPNPTMSPNNISFDGTLYGYSDSQCMTSSEVLGSDPNSTYTTSKPYVQYLAGNPPTYNQIWRPTIYSWTGQYEPPAAAAVTNGELSACVRIDNIDGAMAVFGANFNRDDNISHYTYSCKFSPDTNNLVYYPQGRPEEQAILSNCANQSRLSVRYVSSPPPPSTCTCNVKFADTDNYVEYQHGQYVTSYNKGNQCSFSQYRCDEGLNCGQYDWSVVQNGIGPRYKTLTNCQAALTPTVTPQATNTPTPTPTSTSGSGVSCPFTAPTGRITTTKVDGRVTQVAITFSNVLYGAGPGSKYGIYLVSDSNTILPYYLYDVVDNNTDFSQSGAVLSDSSLSILPATVPGNMTYTWGVPNNRVDVNGVPLNQAGRKYRFLVYAKNINGTHICSNQVVVGTAQ